MGLLLAGLIIPVCVGSAGAHTQSTSFLTIRLDKDHLGGEWHLALRDLEDAIGLDGNDDGLVTWDELESKKAEVFSYAFSRLQLRNGQAQGKLQLTDLLVDNHSDGAYAVLRFDVEGLGDPTDVELNYEAFFDIDPTHRGLLRFEGNGMSQLAVFGPETRTQRINVGRSSPAKTPAWVFVKEGIWHIWRGYDHILFLLALLLPGALRRSASTWEPVEEAKSAVLNVLRIVTAFTIAHSITLSLAVLGIVHLPTKLVEAAIAGSVGLAAMNNLVPYFSERGWAVAFGFGLLHGFGFANALRDLGLRHGQMAITLFGFNLGVELGQLAIVAAFLPLALALRRVVFYPRLVLPLGSVSILVISAMWLAERVLDFKWLPF